MLLEGKKALIFGVANNKSIAWGIAQAFKQAGASLAFNYLGDAIKKRVDPLAEEIGADFTFQCDVSSDEQIAASAQLVKEKWGNVDILVHSVAFANREDLQGDFLSTSRAGFHLALDISAYSLVALCREFSPMMSEGSSVMAMTYYASNKIMPFYNVMAVAKAALECEVRYLANDLGPKGIRVNAISAGPVKTLAASAVHSLKGALGKIEANAPLRRNITPLDVGGTATYLASPLSSAVTGQVIFVDSGISLIMC